MKINNVGIYELVEAFEAGQMKGDNYHGNPLEWEVTKGVVAVIEALGLTVDDGMVCLKVDRDANSLYRFSWKSKTTEASGSWEMRCSEYHAYDTWYQLHKDNHLWVHHWYERIEE